MNRDLFTKNLTSMSLDELLTALQEAATKLGGRPYAHVAADAHLEIKLIKAEITHRFNCNDF